MNRNSKVLNLGNGQVRFQTIIESDSCRADTQESKWLQFELLRRIADDPHMTNCGLKTFQVAKMYHNGDRWIMEFSSDEAKTE